MQSFGIQELLLVGMFQVWSNSGPFQSFRNQPLHQRTNQPRKELTVQCVKELIIHAFVFMQRIFTASRVAWRGIQTAVWWNTYSVYSEKKDSLEFN